VTFGSNDYWAVHMKLIDKKAGALTPSTLRVAYDGGTKTVNQVYAEVTSANLYHDFL
jgi:hypothetical protein